MGNFAANERTAARLELVHSSPVKTHDHPCGIYSNFEELKASVVPYIEDGLRRGELCLYVVNETSKEFLLDALREVGFDPMPYVNSGALRIVHSSEAHMRDGYFCEKRMGELWSSLMAEARAAGFTRVRAAGEMTWALSDAPGCDQLAGYEARLTKFSDENDVALLCMYNQSRFPADKLKAVIHAHPQVVIRNHLMQNPSAVAPEQFDESNPKQDVDALLRIMGELNAALERETALREKAERLLYAQQESQHTKELNEELQALAKIVSHELQEPVGKIRSYLKLLAVRYKGRLGDDANEFIDICSESAELVHRMVDDLWTYARATTAGGIEHRTVSTQGIVNDVLNQHGGLIAATRADVVIGELPNVVGNPSQLRYVFDCLIQNALTYRASGRETKVEVQAAKKSGYWVFSVHDNGVGIDPMHFQDIFRLFYRINERPCEGGTGMGLATSKKIIEAHGGRILVESKPGEGSTFYFSIKA
jgi:signal transduction histidine kinase